MKKKKQDDANKEKQWLNQWAETGSVPNSTKEWIESTNGLSNIIAAPYDEFKLSQKTNEMDAEKKEIRAILKAEFSKIFKDLRKKWEKSGVSERYELIEDFVGTPGEIFTANISLEALGTYLIAIMLPDDYHFTVEDFAKRCRTSKYKMRKCLKELEDCGFLFRQIDRIGSKYVTSYFFVESITAETIAIIFN